MNSGKLTILIILGVAVSAAAFAWWYRWQHVSRAMQFWGSEAAQLIRQGKHAELWLLEPADQGSPADVTSGKHRFRVSGTVELTGKRGLIHARQAFVEDASFAWEDADVREATWRYALRFSDGSEATATVLVDLESRQVRHVEADRDQVLNQRFCDGLKKYLDEVAAPVKEATTEPVGSS